MIAIGLRRCQNEGVNTYYKVEMHPSQLTPPYPSQRLVKDTISMPDYVRQIGAGHFRKSPDRVRCIGGQGVKILPFVWVVCTKMKRLLIDKTDMQDLFGQSPRLY